MKFNIKNYFIPFSYILCASQDKANLLYLTCFLCSDQSIPSLESILSNNEVAAEETNKLSQLIGRQAAVEANLISTQSSSAPAECTPPPVCHDFQTSRLFLSHFGLLSLGLDGEVCKMIFTGGVCKIIQKKLEFCIKKIKEVKND